MFEEDDLKVCKLELKRNINDWFLKGIKFTYQVWLVVSLIQVLWILN